ncbi:MAG: MBL fold metallo-hydrolase [Chloroherpetonaceae bacterium]|nr:MBL fold metallo-hydrolase [Chloroherpetonaceae bacterium]
MIKRDKLYQKSPHFKNGLFFNRTETPNLTEGYTLSQVVLDFFLKGSKRRRPKSTIPSIKTNLKSLPLEKNLLVWFGHSSYYFQLNQKRFLVDPVFSGNASPIPNTMLSFPGSDVFTPNDIPEIDYLILTHDHYDHTDLPTLLKLKHNFSRAILPLGVGEYFENWGFEQSRFSEHDWDERIELENGITVFTKPARHFSGRTLVRNTTLWMSLLVKSDSYKLYLGGDSGYDTHFKEIGNEFGPIDLAVLENGQYNKMWRYVHTSPEETFQAAIDLKAKRLLPVHSSKFALSDHDWDEPLRKISELSVNSPYGLLTPVIGEVVELENENQKFNPWWEGLE